MNSDDLTIEYWKLRLEMAQDEDEREICRRQMWAMICAENEYKDERKLEKLKKAFSELPM